MRGEYDANRHLRDTDHTPKPLQRAKHYTLADAAALAASLLVLGLAWRLLS